MNTIQHITDTERALAARVAELEKLLKRTLDHVHHGSKRSYDGVGGHEKRVEADSLFWAIEAAMQKGTP